jgi:hypothetical protein
MPPVILQPILHQLQGFANRRQLAGIIIKEAEPAITLHIFDVSQQNYPLPIRLEESSTTLMGYLGDLITFGYSVQIDPPIIEMKSCWEWKEEIEDGYAVSKDYW